MYLGAKKSIRWGWALWGGLLFGLSSLFANASVTAPAVDTDGSFVVSWNFSEPYTSPSVAEYLNGSVSRIIPVNLSPESLQITGRSEGVWTYTVTAERLGSDNCDYPPCILPFGSQNNERVEPQSSELISVLSRKLDRNPLFFLVNSAYATTIVAGQVETEVLFVPGATGSISLASTDYDGAYPVTWGAATGSFDRYELEERKGTGSWSRIHNASTRSVSLSARLTSAYSYRVRACNDSGHTTRVHCGAWSSVVTINVVRTPSSITVPPGINTDGIYDVSWASVTGSENYVLQQQKNGGSWSTIDTGSDTVKSESGLLTGKYKYRVAAKAGGVQSDYLTSSEKIVVHTPAAITVPVSDGDGSFSVSWSSVPGATDYQLQQQLDNGSWVLVSTQTATSKSISVMMVGSYKYRVCARFNGSPGGWKTSNAFSVALRPSAITIPVGVDTDGAFTIVWEPVTGADSYILQKQYNGGSWSTVQSGYTSTNYNVNSLLTGRYLFRVAVIEGGVTGDYQTSLEKLVIQTPTIISVPASDGDGSYTVSWSAVNGATDYELERQLGSGSWTAVSVQTGTSKAISDAESGVYKYRVRARFNGNTGSWKISGALNVALQPGSITVPSGIDIDGDFIITWASVPGAESYILQQESAGVWNTVQNDARTIFSAASLLTGSYKFRVATKVGGFTSSYRTSSSKIVIHTPESINVPLSGDNGSYLVSWSEVSNATGYELQQQRDAGSWESIGEQTGTSTTVTVTNSGSYKYRVRAKYSGSGGSWVTSGSVAVPILPPAWVRTTAQGFSVPDATLHSPAILESQNVGAVHGEGGVSGGAATYSISIVIPPGRNGVQPELSVAYNSRSGNGLLGVGWSLKAGSAVHRCPQTIARDGASVPVQYSVSNDRLCLDGQPLILISGSYGTAGSKYRLENDQFLRVTQFGGINGSSTYFTAEIKSGLLRYYGSTPDSRHSDFGVPYTKTWAVSRDEYPSISKNSIIYSYSVFAQGENLLTSISYTGNGLEKGDRQVDIVYQNRPDVSSAYFSGGLSRQTQRVSDIIVKHSDSKVREYNFSYKSSGATQRSLLDAVVECGSDSVCFNPTQFKWLADEEVLSLEKFGLSSYSGGNYKGSGRSVSPLFDTARDINEVLPHGDYNGDGVKDWRGYFVNAEGEQVDTYSAPDGSCAKNFYTMSRYCISIDVNNDGLSDYWRKSSGRLEVALSKGVAGAAAWVSTGLAMDGIDHVVNAADYNGDGWVDIFIRKGSGNYSQNYLYLYLHTGNPSSPYSSPGQQVADYGYDPGDRVYRYDFQFMGDMDGNGLPDLVMYNTPELDQGMEFGAPNFGQPIMHAIYYAERTTGSGVIFGGGSANNIISGTGASPGEYVLFYSIDINSDGLDDWLNWRVNNSFSYKLNKGGRSYSDWVPADFNGSMEVRGFAHTVAEGNFSVYYTSLKYAEALKKVDLGGDGKAEIIFPAKRLMTACSKDYDEGVLTEFCGDDLYRAIDLDPSPKELMFNLNVAEVDRSVYEFDALKFIENSDGTFSLVRIATDYVGTAYQSVVVDAFGNGLDDLIFKVGCPQGSESCRYENRIPGFEDGVHIVRNGGSAQNDELYSPSDFLISSSDAMGRVNEWSYRPLSSHDDRYHKSGKPFYERGGYFESLKNEFPTAYNDHLEFTSSMYVVSEHRQSNGIGDDLNLNQYRYKGAVFNSKGRGFQGFHTIIEEDLAANIEIQSDFHQIFPLAGKLHKQRKWELDDRDSDVDTTKAFIESDFIWQFWPLGGHGSPVIVDGLTDNWSIAANDPYFVGPSQQSTTHRTLGNTRTFLYKQTQGSSFDQWGNVLLASTRYEEANSSHIIASSTDTEYAPADEVKWWLNKPVKQTVTKYPIQSRRGVDIALGTDPQREVDITYESWDSDARKPTSVLTDPSSGKWTRVVTSYSAHGLPNKVTTTAEGEAQSHFVETVEFSSDGYFPKVVKNALRHSVMTITNSAFGKPDSVTDANGLTTSFGYDGFGRTITVTAPSALGVKAAPDAHTALQWCNSNCNSAPGAIYKTIQQQAGTPERITYHDKLGRVIRAEVEAFSGNDWIATKVKFNALGQVTFESVPHYASSPNNYGTRYSDGYDTLGRALGKTVDKTNGQQLDIDYTHEQGTGFTTNILVNGRSMSRTYNGLQQLVQTVDAAAGSTDYAYDGAGNPIVLQDAATNRIIALYNALGQKDWVDDPNMGVKTFTYTGFGEVQGEGDANGNATVFEYDRLGRMQSRSVNGVEEANWVYDTAVKGLPYREQKSNGGFVRTYGYDSLNRPSEITTTIDGEDFVTVNHYDSNYGRLKGLSYPSGLTLQYSYNSSGYPFRTSNAASGYTYREITEMDAWGEWSAANVAADNYVIGRAFHAETGQMMGTAFDSLVQQHQTLSYDSYDNFGNLSQMTVGVPSENPAINTETYLYDALNRLDYSSRTNGPTVDYDYDAIGNLLKKDDFASSYTYTGGSSGGPSAVKSVSMVGGGTRSYGYDQNGNRTHESGVQQIWYNAFNKPTRVKRNGADLYFSYGANQMRYKQINQGSGKTTLYIDKLFERITEGGKTHYRHFIEDIAVVTTTETSSETTHKIGFTHRDRLGSTVAIGDHQGNLKETHSFDPFGKPRQGNITDKLPSVLDSQLTSRGFTDHEHLDDVALIHMNGRAYDYNLGRFLSVDPIIQSPGDSQSLNPYSYIMNNPLSGTDPSGYFSCDASRECEDVASDLEKGETVNITQKQSATGSRIPQNTKVGTMTGNGNGTVTVQIKGGSLTVDIGSQNSRGNVAGSDQSGQGSEEKYPGTLSRETASGAQEGLTVSSSLVALGTAEAKMLQESNQVLLNGDRIRSLNYYGNQFDSAELVKAAKEGQLKLVRISQAAGGAGYVLTAVNISTDAYQFRTGELSTGRYVYRHTGNTIAIGLAVVGSGGWAAVIGLGFFGSEKLYDHAIVPGARVVRQEVRKVDQVIERGNGAELVTFGRELNLNNLFGGER